jgi:hypothetical protein
MRYRMLSPTGDYVFGNGPGEFLVDSSAAVAQAISTRLKLWQGEWFLDQTQGVPYPTQILGYNTQASYDAAIQTAILNTPGVSQLLAYSSTLTRSTRALSISATVETIYSSTPITVNV